MVVPQSGMKFHFGELLPGVGCILTSLETDSRDVARFYNKRATAEVTAATDPRAALSS